VNYETADLAFCVVDNCPNLATRERPAGFRFRDVETVELVCEEHYDTI